MGNEMYEKQEALFRAMRQEQTIGPNLTASAKEAYQSLRTRLELALSEKNGSRIYGITSLRPGTGITTAVINLAYTWANAGKPVLIVEGNLRTPSLAQRLSLGEKPGLTELLQNPSQTYRAIQKTWLSSNLQTITAGKLPEDPAGILGSEKMAGFLQELRKEYEIILLDLPAVTEGSDVMAAAKLTDGMMLLAEKTSRRRDADPALETLKLANCNLLGVVLTETAVDKGRF